jgi:hypothetical protein
MPKRSKCRNKRGVQIWTEELQKTLTDKIISELFRNNPMYAYNINKKMLLAKKKRR